MMVTTMMILQCVLALMAIACAAVLLEQNRKGWGWFLFAGIFFGSLNISVTETAEPEQVQEEIRVHV